MSGHTSDHVVESAKKQKKSESVKISLSSVAYTDICKSLECPCCMEIKTCSYVECPNGHSTCTSCMVKIMQAQAQKPIPIGNVIDMDTETESDKNRRCGMVPCPTCKTGFDMSKRSRLLEYLISTLEVCSCDNSGCELTKTMMTKAVANQHMEVCKFRRIDCPFRPNSYMCANRCNGTYIPGQLMDHIDKEHNSSAVLSSSTCPRDETTMSVRFRSSIKSRPVSNPRRSHRTGVKVSSITLDVLLNTASDLKAFLNGSNARLFIVEHMGIMYTIYVCLPNSRRNMSITVRGDFPLDLVSTPPLRVCTYFPRTLTKEVDASLFGAEVAHSVKKHILDKALWVENQCKLVKNCASFANWTEDEQSDSAKSTANTCTVGVNNCELTDFCKPCGNPACQCTAHFRVRVEFPDEI
jgi:hypothetical protein